MNKKCECCGKKLEISFGATRFCSGCSIYNCDRSNELSNLKQKVEKLKQKLVTYKK